MEAWRGVCPRRNRVEIETTSDDQRTVIARRSPEIGFIERISAKGKLIIEGAYSSVGDRLIAGGPPHDARRTALVMIHLQSILCRAHAGQ
ncbi:hypothetical protein DPMN_053309 [Dreissena polymorpha]|uniref:Uncharacterized protein n=1 Tax=Dreissena polymorpha TaxID=45954 RepID=A0A9D4HQL1_DREPO|nr:hypothetical protein DPMN_053309 [Dreissena polymorpha]